MVVSWLVFPIALGAVSLGCGLLARSASGTAVPGGLLVPVGFATIVVVVLFASATGATAAFATPLVVGLAVAGTLTAIPLDLRTIEWPAVTAATGVWAVYAAPVVLSGQATFAGYAKLDDTANWLGLTDRLFEHGRTLSGLMPSTYQALLDLYWRQNGYPMGALTGLGVGHVLVRTDTAWLVQPYVCFLAALLALGIYQLLERVVDPRWLRCFAAFVAAQPALLYGYSLWVGVKELASAGLIALIAALILPTLRSGLSARSTLPVAIATSALFGVLNLGSGVWLVPLLVPAVAIGIGWRGRGAIRVAATYAAVTIALSIPTLRTSRAFLDDLRLNSNPLDTGNLIRPLSRLEELGIWPTGDFRQRPASMTVVYVLLAALLVAAAAGLVWACRRRAWEVPLYVAAATIGCALAIRKGSIWIDGKAVATASPAFLVAGMTGVAWLVQCRRRAAAVGFAVVIAGGVLWSNALAYQAVWLAPRAQLAELETIGKRFRGDGPVLMTEYEVYGVRHFLRDMDPEGAGGVLDLRPVPLRNGLITGSYADVDDLQLAPLLAFPTLVIGRSPAASRPPSVYRLAWSGRFYEVWRRPRGSEGVVLDHLPLGEGDQPAAVPACADVLRLAREARLAGGVLAAVPRRPAVVVPLADAQHPADWTSYEASPDVLYSWSLLRGSRDVVYPQSAGTIDAGVRVASSGRYGIWLGGSFRRPIEILVDGKVAAKAGYQLNNVGVYTQLGDIPLARGFHGIQIRSGSASLAPGSGGPPFPLGPLTLSASTADLPVSYLQPVDARSLCGRSLDWIEVVAG